MPLHPSLEGTQIVLGTRTLEGRVPHLSGSYDVYEKWKENVLCEFVALLPHKDATHSLRKFFHYDLTFPLHVVMQSRLDGLSLSHPRDLRYGVSGERYLDDDVFTLIEVRRDPESGRYIQFWCGWKRVKWSKHFPKLVIIWKVSVYFCHVMWYEINISCPMSHVILRIKYLSNQIFR